MNSENTPATPTSISLHQKSRLLEIAFSDGFSFQFPCEYLRVFSPAHGKQPLDRPVQGKEQVNIQTIEPRAEGGLQLRFDDGHKSEYTWSDLHALGVNYQPNWESYLQELEQRGLRRGPGRTLGPDGKVHIRLLYFIQLARLAGRDAEDVGIPDSVTNVETLLAWLRTRGDDWKDACAADKVQVTVNKQFAELYTLIEHGDEVALVPRPQ